MLKFLHIKRKAPMNRPGKPPTVIPCRPPRFERSSIVLGVVYVVAVVVVLLDVFVWRPM
jgi:hypothetical protein